MDNRYSDEHISTAATAYTDTPDDHVLIAAIAKGDSSALEALYDRYSSVVYRMALRMLKNRELAEEVVQEVFWRVWRRSASFDNERGRVAQWLFGIAHNLCIDELRRMRARPTQIYEDVDHPVIQQLADEQIDVPEAAWVFEQQRVIRDALGHLPEAQRQAVELAYFGGLSHQEIATKLNRPLGTIKTRVRLGLQKLGTLLTARGLQPGDAS
ncbi:RNA polymerase sigma factor [Roseiflexus sp.]|uniref:RNA polymerase sigma factor n=1 Tax=Roseiflexus sp. TaxID=2562120 RepID=UPI0021DDE286|nr:sigma-70 family RNA polymerase sigma factor [Roseiflexus sp.]GIV99622.1 MAG: DNA-directed RNA polymerase sigma-70 factor [Roseiflexus sp.]